MPYAVGYNLKKLKVLGIKNDKITFHPFILATCPIPCIGKLVASDILCSLNLHIIIPLNLHGRCWFRNYPLPFLFHVTDSKYFNSPLHIRSCLDIFKHVTFSWKYLWQCELIKPILIPKSYSVTIHNMVNDCTPLICDYVQ